MTEKQFEKYLDFLASLEIGATARFRTRGAKAEVVTRITDCLFYNHTKDTHILHDTHSFNYTEFELEC
jgi:hypothetical protein